MTNRDVINQTVDAYIKMQDDAMPANMRLWCVKCAESGVKVIERTWEALSKLTAIPLVPSDLAPLIVRIGFLMVREGLKRSEEGSNDARSIN